MFFNIEQLNQEQLSICWEVFEALNTDKSDEPIVVADVLSKVHMSKSAIYRRFHCFEEILAWTLFLLEVKVVEEQAKATQEELALAVTEMICKNAVFYKKALLYQHLYEVSEMIVDIGMKKTGLINIPEGMTGKEARVYLTEMQMQRLRLLAEWLQQGMTPETMVERMQLFGELETTMNHPIPF